MSDYKSATLVTPSNTVDQVYDAILVGTTAGNVKVDTAASETAVVLTGLQKGVIYPIAVTRIYAADLTAAGITGFRK